MDVTRRGFIATGVLVALTGCSADLLGDPDVIVKEHSDADRVRANMEFDIQDDGTVRATLLRDGTTVLSVYAEIDGIPFEDNTIFLPGQSITITPDQYTSESGDPLEIQLYGTTDQQHQLIYRIRTQHIELSEV